MLSDQLKVRGTELVQQLGLENALTPQKWMAHYLAELMDRAENGKTDRLREEAKRRTEKLILKLWEIEKDKVVNELRFSIRANLQAKYEKRPLDATLGQIIDRTEVPDTGELAFDDILLMQLDDIELDLLRLRLISRVVSVFEKDTISEEAITELDRFEPIYDVTRHQLEDVWTEVANIGIGDLAGNEHFVEAKLKAIQRLRNLLI